MSLINEVIESFRTHPEKWSWEIVSDKYGEWFCYPCSYLPFITNRFRVSKQRSTDFDRCSHCNLNRRERVAGFRKLVLLKHESGVVLENATPDNDRDWHILKPEFTTLGFWDSRKLNRAVTKLRKQHMKLKLFDIEI